MPSRGGDWMAPYSGNRALRGETRGESHDGHLGQSETDMSSNKGICTASDTRTTYENQNLSV